MKRQIVAMIHLDVLRENLREKMSHWIEIQATGRTFWIGTAGGSAETILLVRIQKKSTPFVGRTLTQTRLATCHHVLVNLPNLEAMELILMVASLSFATECQ